jgi:hypothetical protein
MSGRPVGFVMPYRATNPYEERGGGFFRICVSVDAETYAEIDKLAKRDNCRVARMAVTLIEVGLMEFDKEAAQ